MMRYDQHNALMQLARQCNKECQKLTAGHKPADFAALTRPVFDAYALKCASIGVTKTALKYQIAVLNGQIQQR